MNVLTSTSSGTNRWRKSVAVALSTALAVTVSLAGAGSAHASTEDREASETITSPMTIAGYDADVAKANGYKIVTLPDGTQESVPVTAAAKKAEQDIITPFTTVPGDCGTSSVVILDDGNAGAAVSTGFHLVRGAISYGWTVNVTGPGGGYTKNFGGVLANTPRWTGSFRWSVPVRGTYIAAVTKASWALLNNGTVCTSGGPIDSEYIYR